MRYLVTLPQESSDLESIAAYCSAHAIDLRRATWYMDSESYQFHVIYSEDDQYLHWLAMAYPNRFFAF